MGANRGILQGFGLGTRGRRAGKRRDSHHHAPKSFVTEGGRLQGMMFEKLEYDVENGDIKATRSLGDVFIPCDDVILALDRKTPFPG